MTFATAKQIAAERLNEVLLYLNHLSSIEPVAGLAVPQDLKIMKGMFFVLLYGALEKSTHESIYLLLLKIKALEPKNEHVIRPFNVVSMARRWKAIKDTGYKNVFTQMSGFFASIDSAECHGIDESLFSALLQNIWAETIEEVVQALGISAFTLAISDRVVINELVDKRNKIAHGRESATVIGEGYRTADLRKRLQDIQVFIIKFIDRLEIFYDQREFVLPAHKILYP